MNKKSIIELCSIIGVFTIAYFIIMGNASKFMGVDFENDLYKNTIKTIETQATLYGKYKEDLFSEGNTVYVTVSQLANENFVRSGKDGVVLDPRDESKTLNDVKVKIYKEKDEVKAKVLV